MTTEFMLPPTVCMRTVCDLYLRAKREIMLGLFFFSKCVPTFSSSPEPRGSRGFIPSDHEATSKENLGEYTMLSALILAPVLFALLS